MTFHSNEKYLTTLSDLEVTQLLLDAEILGKNYLAALKEQLTRLKIIGA